MISILLVDDQEEELQALRFQLGERYRILLCQDPRRACSVVKREAPAAVILDIEMPGYDGFKVLADLANLPERPPILMLSAYSDPLFVVRALRGGAGDFISKPYTIAMLRARLQKLLSLNGPVIGVSSTLRDAAPQEGRRRRRQSGPLPSGVDAILGVSDSISQVRKDVLAAARCALPVLVIGETGTGKELVARAIHYHSGRRSGPFVVRNLGAIPEHVAEGELFGCDTGAYTDAKERPGCFEAADGGTLFLDELADAAQTAQAALLRTVEDGMVRRLGSNRLRSVDVRLVAAMNRSPEGAQRDGRLRSDLFYRLDGFRITLPPLRERKEDIRVLAQSFAEHAPTPSHFASDGAFAILEDQEWPGNVRQLRMAVERAAVMANGSPLEAQHFTRP